MYQGSVYTKHSGGIFWVVRVKTDYSMFDRYTNTLEQIYKYTELIYKFNLWAFALIGALIVFGFDKQQLSPCLLLIALFSLAFFVYYAFCCWGAIKISLQIDREIKPRLNFSRWISGDALVGVTFLTSILFGIISLFASTTFMIHANVKCPVYKWVDCKLQLIGLNLHHKEPESKEKSPSSTEKNSTQMSSNKPSK